MLFRFVSRTTVSELAPIVRVYVFIAWMWISIGLRGSAQEEVLLDPQEVEFFRAKVEPILVEHCYGCHSHGSGTMEAGLTLDWRGGWSTGGDSGPAIVPTRPDESLLIHAVRRGKLAMPPDAPLSKEAMEILEQWVAKGAIDPRTSQIAAEDRLPDTQWWSFLPLHRPSLPSVESRTDLSNPVDRFLAAQTPSIKTVDLPEADRRQLIRRLSFDLLGVPPTMAEVQEYEADEREDAYERLVDRLLSSPRYGERWARHWMDTIHFADTHGFEHDVMRPNAWPYRDYLIDRLNRDLPWAEFVREQLAVDYFQPTRTDLLPALGFLGAGTFDFSSYSTAPVNFVYQDRDDLVTQVCSSFLSVTANCARCHHHKFDPISQEDYYSLQAVFAGITKGDIPFDIDAEVATKRQEYQRWLSIAQRKDAAELLAVEFEKSTREWLVARSASAHTDVWKPILPETYSSTDGTEYAVDASGSLLATGTPPERETTLLTVSPGLSSFCAIKIEVLTDPSLPVNGPGRAANGNLHLSEFEVIYFQAREGQAPLSKKLEIAKATADFDQEGWTAQHAIDRDPKTAWGIHPQEGKDHFIVFELKERLSLQPNDRLAVAIKQIHGGSHLIGRLRMSISDRDSAVTSALPSEIENALAVSEEHRTIEQQVQIASFVLKNRANLGLGTLPAQRRVYAAGKQVLEGVGAPAVTLASPRKVHFMRRGDVARPEQEMHPGAIASLCAPDQGAIFSGSESEDEAKRRAALAEWIVHPQHPLTWRSIVNRVWHYHFGSGICDTPSDFGRMGGENRNLELMDWLACEFRDQGGSLKWLHRTIVTSQAYRAQANSNNGSGSPNNRWWSRLPMRLDADSYRDAVRVASGSIDWEMRGAALQQFSTSPGAQITPKVNYDTYDWHGRGAGRRSIYRFVWRGIADPFMELLDFPDLGLLSPVRGNTNSALQSLSLYNNRFVVEHAQMMAKSIERQQSDPGMQIELAFHRSLQRSPTESERNLLIGLLRKHGLASVCRILMNCNEFVYVE